MPRGKALTEQQKGKTLVISEEEYGVREIGRRINRSHRGVHNFLSSPLEYGACRRQHQLQLERFEEHCGWKDRTPNDLWHS